MNRYRKKPVVIEAIEYDGKNSTKIAEFMEEGLFETEKMVEGRWIKCLNIETLEGTVTANEGDYIIKGINGEFYPCKPDVFYKTYDKI